MSEEVTVKKEEFPIWLRESEFYQCLEEGDVTVDKRLLLHQPRFDTVEDIEQFLFIINFLCIDINPYMDKIHNFMKDNYYLFINILHKRDYGIYKELFMKFEGPLFHINVKREIKIRHENSSVTRGNINLVIEIQHRNMILPFYVNQEIEFDEDFSNLREILSCYVEGFMMIYQMLSGMFNGFACEHKAKQDRIQKILNFCEFKKSIEGHLDYVNLMENYIRTNELNDIYDIRCNEHGMLLINLTEFDGDNLIFCYGEKECKIGFCIESHNKICHPFFLTFTDLNIIKDEFKRVYDEILKLPFI
jgi:hypothetical protein